MTAIQAKRLLQIATPLGENYLLINRISGREAISELFGFELELLHLEDEPGMVSTRVDETKILGKQVTVKISQRDGTEREFSGIVSTFARGERNTRFSMYHATVVPHIWLLTQITNSRIFQQKSVPQILETLLSGFEYELRLRRQYKPRNYCVQYDETDFNFISRLMEDEGIFYYFTHSDGKHKLVIADDTTSHSKVPSNDKIDYYLNVPDEEDFVPTIRELWRDTRLRTGKVTMWDRHFQLPQSRLDKTEQSRFKVADNTKLERYVYPGGYAKKYDEINRAGGETGSLNDVYADRERTVRDEMDGLDVRFEELSARSDCSSLTAGHKFSLQGHPDSEFNKDYIVTSIRHEAEQNPQYISADEVEEPYASTFSCISAGKNDPPFVPESTASKPVIVGCQTATVVGGTSGEIFTDKYGRIKVQFHWDREGNLNDASSCWVRVAQMWAGNKWGAMFIPRVNMEVVVNFEGGDPDLPIVTGCVYNPGAMPAYTLPDEKTKSFIKSDSEGGYNEIRFEDKKGKEQLFLRAEKDLDIRVKNDRREMIEKNRHLIVNKSRYSSIKRDDHMDVGGDRNERVKGSASLDVKTSIHEKAGQNYALSAGQQIHLKSGMSLTLETGTNLTLKVGGNFININPGGIFIKGNVVMINSGGSPGSGPGSHPDPPKPPTEADDGDPGTRIKPPKLGRPPDKPSISGLVANAFKQASDGGSAFVSVFSESPAPSTPETKPPPPPPPSTAPAPVVAPPSNVTEELPKDPSKKHWVEIILVDREGNPVPGVKYRITPPGGGAPKEGVTDQNGQGGYWNYDSSGDWKITFPDLDKDAWE